jgi:hypothetical protein
MPLQLQGVRAQAQLASNLPELKRRCSPAFDTIAQASEALRKHPNASAIPPPITRSILYEGARPWPRGRSPGVPRAISAGRWHRRDADRPLSSPSSPSSRRGRTVRQTVRDWRIGAELVELARRPRRSSAEDGTGSRASLSPVCPRPSFGVAPVDQYPRSTIRPRSPEGVARRRAAAEKRVTPVTRVNSTFGRPGQLPARKGRDAGLPAEAREVLTSRSVLSRLPGLGGSIKAAPRTFIP